MSKLSDDELLADEIGKFYDDPLGFVMFAYDWGVGELEGFDGPDEWQRDFLNDLGVAIKKNKFDGVKPVDPYQDATSSGHGIGKAQPYSLKIDTPNGVLKWCDIHIGDSLFGRDGKPTKVIARHEQGERDIYRVSFNDGSSTLVDIEHVWSVKGRQQRRTNKDFITLTTKELLIKGVKRKNGESMARQWEIPSSDPVEYKVQDLPIDPYILGSWLADGTKACGAITNGDYFVFDYAESLGYELGTDRCSSENARTHTLKGLKVQLRDAGILGCTSDNCSVPTLYKQSSIRQRTSLLQGLLDGDGWVEKSGTVGYGSISENLAIDVLWLSRSLGLVARLNKVKDKWYPNNYGERVYCKPFYTVSITYDGDTKLFMLDRKQSLLHNPQDRYKKRWIDSIEFSHKEKSMCVTVDADDSLYLTNDFIVTHNSALTAWLTNFIMSTRPFCKGVVTANTASQLQTKTWAEVAKWTKRSINGHWFDITTGMGSMHMTHKEHPSTWRVDALTCTKENTDSFAGLHAVNSTPFYIFDEASSVPDGIWDVAEGGQTDGEPMWFVFGNPTKSSGRFHSCFNRQKHRWNTRQIDSRTVKLTNKKKIQEWVDDYGEDSDFVRVRVRGQFPKQGSLQFIPSNYVQYCKDYEFEVYKGAIRSIGVDVARFGDDQTVISYKSGRKIYPMHKYRELDTMQTAALVVEGIESFKPHAVFIDGGGVGGGVVDRLTQMGYHVFDVNFGSGANDDRKYSNKRCEMYGLLKDAMKAGLDFPDDIELEYELQAIEYDYNDKQQVRLESKKAMKKRGLASPDCADSVALHFAEPINMTEVDEDEGMNYNHRQDGRNQTTGY